VVYYCNQDHQKAHWVIHKLVCKVRVAAAPAQPPEDEMAARYRVLKENFEAVVAKHGLNSNKNSDRIADFLTRSDREHTTAGDFATEFSIPVDDADKFLQWVNVGLDFKERFMDPHNEELQAQRKANQEKGKDQ